MKLIILLMTFALTGCGAWVKASTPRSVVIAADNVRQATRLAEQECGKHGRLPRFVMEHRPLNFTFDCVE